MKFILILVCLCISYVLADAALNHAISLAIGNAIENGDFQTIQLGSNDLSAKSGSCHRLMLWKHEGTAYPGALGRVFEAGEIKVGISTTFNISTFFQLEGDQSSGYYAEVGKIMAHHLGLVLGKRMNLEFVPYDAPVFYDDTIRMLNDDMFDTAIGVTYLVSRLNRSDFTCAYEAPVPFAVYRDESVELPSGFAAPNSLEGWNDERIKVATIAGSVYAAAAEKFLPLAEKVFFDSDGEAFRAVGTEADITLFDIVSLDVFSAANDNKLIKQAGTEIKFAGGTGFITKQE